MSLLKTILITGLLILAASAIVLASAPGLLNYQGKLSDPVGDPIADGTYSITFSIWSDPTLGESKWSETQASVMVSDGVFSALLGAVEPLNDSVFNDPNRFLQISVNGEAIVPRIQITSAGYAQRVNTIDGANGGYITDSLVIVSSGEGLLLRSSRAEAFAAKSRIELGISEAGVASIAMFEPVDSKIAMEAGEGKRVELRQDGLIMFGISDQDTTLIVEPNGDIRSIGQITMGENSSDGAHTSVLGFENTADGDSSTIGGGSGNVAQGQISVIAGGHANTTLSEGGTISGGSFNEVTGPYATISGGQNNSAAGSHAVIPGGTQNIANGSKSLSMGYRAQALHDGSFVWADQTDEDFGSTAPDQFLVRATNGVGINTNTPIGMLDVSGSEGDESVNLPMSAVSAPEILDEAGLASERTSLKFSLAQDGTSMEQILSVSITIPAPGYIVLRAGGTIEATGTSKQNQAMAQISESGIGTVESAYTVRVGAGDQDTPSSTHYFNLATERIFAKDSGTYTFYLEAMAAPGNGSAAITRIANSNLTATYLPTAYGIVTAIVSENDNGNYDRTEYIGGDGSTEMGGLPGTQNYKVDLRELELRALKARLEAERAEKELLEARLRQ